MLPNVKTFVPKNSKVPKPEFEAAPKTKTDSDSAKEETKPEQETPISENGKDHEESAIKDEISNRINRAITCSALLKMARNDDHMAQLVRTHHDLSITIKQYGHPDCDWIAEQLLLTELKRFGREDVDLKVTVASLEKRLDEFHPQEGWEMDAFMAIESSDTLAKLNVLNERQISKLLGESRDDFRWRIANAMRETIEKLGGPTCYEACSTIMQLAEAPLRKMLAQRYKLAQARRLPDTPASAGAEVIVLKQAEVLASFFTENARNQETAQTREMTP